MLLPLHGVASFVRGYEDAPRSQIIRTRSVDCLPDTEVDAAIIRNEQDALAAASSGFVRGVVIGEETGVVGSNDLPNLLVVPSRFEYLGDGDIIGLQAFSRRFRTLYRRSSKHNSFLVTERCNHYCLMCS